MLFELSVGCTQIAGSSASASSLSKNGSVSSVACTSVVSAVAAATTTMPVTASASNASSFLIGPSLVKSWCTEISTLAGGAEKRCCVPVNVWWRCWCVRQTCAMDSIDCDALQAKIEQGDDFVLVDARSPMAFAQSRLPGAVNLPSIWVDERARKVIPDGDTEIVVYCENTDCDSSTSVA